MRVVDVTHATNGKYYIGRDGQEISAYHIDHEIECGRAVEVKLSGEYYCQQTPPDVMLADDAMVTLVARFVDGRPCDIVKVWIYA